MEPELLNFSGKKTWNMLSANWMIPSLGLMREKCLTSVWKKITEEVEEGQGPAAEVSHPQDDPGRPPDIRQSGVDQGLGPDHKYNE